MNLRHVLVAYGIQNGHLILGEGNLNLREMLQELDESGYEGFLSLEILNDRYMREPEKAMEISYQKLKEYINI